MVLLKKQTMLGGTCIGQVASKNAPLSSTIGEMAVIMNRVEECLVAQNSKTRVVIIIIVHEL